MMRMVMFAYLSVARAEKAVPLLLTFAAAALLFSTHLHSHSGWVIATIFTFPISFLAWQSTNSRDLFGWKVNGAMVRRLVRAVHAAARTSDSRFMQWRECAPACRTTLRPTYAS